MKISIGSDHRGLEQRRVLTQAIESRGHEVLDHGSFTETSCDYPDIATLVCQAVVAGETDSGILVCGTGIGMSIAANKIAGIRAAVCNSVEAVRLSRAHNNANVLCLAGNDYDPNEYAQMVEMWINEPFEGGRHANRVDKISEIESNCNR